MYSIKVQVIDESIGAMSNWCGSGVGYLPCISPETIFIADKYPDQEQKDSENKVRPCIKIFMFG